MTDPLVSIVTPCYNCENHISRYLDSIIGQTYKNIELVLINDGSNDNTESIINSYTSKLKKRGIDLIYITQKNSGVSEALNTGLKHFSGDYRPDSPGDLPGVPCPEGDGSALYLTYHHRGLLYHHEEDLVGQAAG